MKKLRERKIIKIKREMKEGKRGRNLTYRWEQREGKTISTLCFLMHVASILLKFFIQSFN